MWNGNEWSKVTIRKTGSNKNLIRVKLSNGSFIDCTKEHKFYIKKNYHSKEDEVAAQDLQVGDKLIKITKLPVIKYKENEEFENPYTHGFFCGDGTTYDNYSKTTKYPKAYLYGEKKQLLEYLNYESYSENKLNDRYDLVLPKDLESKFTVPMYSSLKDRLSWLEGYVDADGTIAKNGTNESMQITSTNFKFLTKVRLMIQTLGAESKIVYGKKARVEALPDGKGGKKEYNCKQTWRLLISSTGIYKLSQIGFNPKRLKFTIMEPNRNAEQFVKVVKIEKSYENVDTYCFTEHKRHKGIFNGVITGQCAEIVQYSDGEATAVCNLASICLPRFIKNENGVVTFDYEKLMEVTRIIVRNLNKIIDINFYPIESTRQTNKMHRPMGIGVQGNSDCYNLFSFPYESAQAIELNKKIFETIYFTALSESNILAKKYGHYSSFKKSPFSQGKLQFHLWGMTVDDLITKNDYDWNQLITDIKKYGTRNSLLTALMPTAGTSQIMKCYESFEPYMSNMFVRTTIAGEFIVINENLVNDLIKENLWSEDMRKLIIINKGSVQNISNIPQKIKDIYKTAFEIKLKSIISQAADRGPFIDQSQSMNLFMNKLDPDILTSAHFYGWERGLKTGMYYLRTTPAVEPIQFGIDISDIQRLTGKSNAMELIMDSYKMTSSTAPTVSGSEGNELMCKYIPGKSAEGCLMCSS